MFQTPPLPPCLTLRVGVTGHRPNKLAGADLDDLHRRARAVLGCLRQVCRRLQAARDLSEVESPPATAAHRPQLRFATAIAAGADSLAADAAIAEGYDLDLILPFLRDAYIASQHFTFEERGNFERLWAHAPERTTRTELDIQERLRDGEAYRDAGLLMLARSDVLLAIWDGARAAGMGGTAEIVAEAQRRGLVVVWLALDGSLRLWTPVPEATDAGGRGYWQELQIDAECDPRANLLAARVHDLLARAHQ